MKHTPLEKQIYTNSGWQRVLFLVIPYMIFVGGFQAAGYYLAGLDFRQPTYTKTSEQSLIVMTFTLLGLLILIAVFRKWIDKKPFKDLGFHLQYAGRDIFTGTWLGLIIMVTGLTLLLLFGQIQITGFYFNIYEILLSVLLFIMISVNEEILIRGYILQNLMLSFNKYTSLVLSSLLFTVLHLFNPNVDIPGVISLFFAGLLLGMCYVRTKSLWLPIALHFSWNFFQCLFGFNVSGMEQYSLITTTFSEGNIWNGGEFGFEGSVFSSLFQIPAIVFIYNKYRNRSASTILTEANEVV